MVSLAERKKAKKKHGERLKERVVQIVRQSVGGRGLEEDYLMGCIDAEIQGIQAGYGEV